MRIIVLLAGFILAAVAALPPMLAQVSTYQFLPRGFGHVWDKSLLTLHIVSNSLIF